MKLRLHRDVFTPEYTLGRLDVDGAAFCFTVEDVVRDNTLGTAIPAGTYHLELLPSDRAQAGALWTPTPPILPLVLGVKGRSGIRIHAGNTAADVIGCIVVGYDRTQNGVGRSREALTALMRGMFNSLHLNDLTITEEKRHVRHRETVGNPAGGRAEDRARPVEEGAHLEDRGEAGSVR